MMMRPYNATQDLEAVCRIWQEAGWMVRGEETDAAAGRYFSAGRTWVAEVNGAAESVVASLPGAFHYLDETLTLGGVASVATSRIARKQGLAARLLAQLLAEEAAAGVAVARLGIFEQGFYNQFGFGALPYVRWVAFDPAQLQVPAARIPRRVTQEDGEAAHAARLTRMTGHGACTLLSADLTRNDMILSKIGFGLGYNDGPDGALSHYVWFSADDVESGPYWVWHLIYQNGAQLLELAALMRSLGDQVRMICLREPHGIQFQDLLKQPFRFRQLTSRGKFENRAWGDGYHQIRICDLAACLAKTHLPGETARFNLALTDPISNFLDADAHWRGIGGEYVITLGPESAAAPGSDPALPTLTATVNAFSRMWIGARQPSRLAVTDALAGPPELLRALDRVVRLPAPEFDWDY